MKTTLTAEQILFGDPNREDLDPIDKEVLREMVKAGAAGTTTGEMLRAMLGRPLTEKETGLVEVSEEMGAAQDLARDGAVMRKPGTKDIIEVAKDLDEWITDPRIRETMTELYAFGYITVIGRRADGHFKFAAAIPLSAQH